MVAALAGGPAAAQEPHLVFRSGQRPVTAPEDAPKRPPCVSMEDWKAVFDAWNAWRTADELADAADKAVASAQATVGHWKAEVASDRSKNPEDRVVDDMALGSFESRLKEARARQDAAYAAEAKAGDRFQKLLAGLKAKGCPPPTAATPPHEGAQDKQAKGPPQPGGGGQPPNAPPPAANPQGPAPKPKCDTCAKLDGQIADNQAKIDRLQRSNAMLRKANVQDPGIQRALAEDTEKIADLEKQSEDLRAKKAACEKICAPRAGGSTVPSGGALPEAKTQPTAPAPVGKTKAPTPAPSSGHASLTAPGCDQTLVAVLNQARADPAGFADQLATYRTYFRGNLVAEPGRPLAATTEGVVAVDSAIADLRGRQPAPPLVLETKLEASASRLAEDLGPKGGLGHTGSDGSTLRTRMQDAGVYASVMEEDVSLMQTTALGIVRQLIIDDGVPSRGHRSVMFNPNLTLVGFGGAPHATYGTMCVLDFAGGFMSTPPASPSQPPAPPPDTSPQIGEKAELVIGGAEVLTALAWGWDGQSNPAAGGGPAPPRNAHRVSLNDVTFDKSIDKGSPVLFLDCCTAGQRLGSGILRVERRANAAASAAPFLEFKLDELIVTSVSPGAQTPGPAATSVTLNFSSIELTYGASTAPSAAPPPPGH
jgi:uncharacterized protein YkwD/type VI protein secretion system component Hcp